MPTIKTKKEMNLGELLCWAIENKEQASLKDFYSKNIGVKFNASGYPCIEFEKKFLPTYETFTVDIEEPITEDTVVDNLVEINELIDFKKEGLLGGVHLYKNSSINQVENDKSVAYYIMNNDLEMTLIWTKEKGLVE